MYYENIWYSLYLDNPTNSNENCESMNYFEYVYAVRVNKRNDNPHLTAAVYKTHKKSTKHVNEKCEKFS